MRITHLTSKAERGKMKDGYTVFTPRQMNKAFFGEIGPVGTQEAGSINHKIICISGGISRRI